MAAFNKRISGGECRWYGYGGPIYISTAIFLLQLCTLGYLPPGKFEGITSSHEANRHPKQQTQQSIGGRDRLLPGDDGLGLLI